MPELPLTGRVALVTGVSRRRGIGHAISRRLADLGASLVVHGYPAHDADQPWGADDADAVTAELRDRLHSDARVVVESGDLADADEPARLMAAATEAVGHVDILVCNHARSGGDGHLAVMTPAMLDGHWQVNARSTLLLTQAFAAQHDGRPGGRAVWFTSGQGLGPMPDEIAYATSKAALAGMTASVAAWLIERGIGLNTVNPGPVNTGYLDDDTRDRPQEALDWVRSQFPQGRVGKPDDPARLIAWLATDDARWIVGEVINSEGGFRRG
ncbi:SDR family oxidoreductase [Parenemella sanctibonifatiensis]|uniref:3-ketoacyl-ACP reductase n=1 Tax=Parenemella sanctibonifatiensis TaxID=2016505 RepID=A0A255ELY5_9ACTN|nr:SDR family oxidoreductase [Parenemella sanctibonifatiensis]OYN89143.1 3-ketoacyl-ACP reductase [Parenemella sanctibonifatiensis]